MNLQDRFHWHWQNMLARTGLQFLKASGAYDGYWGNWRGPLFEEAQAKGLHVLPVHYYSPIPNTEVSAVSSKSSQDSVPGIDLQIDSALSLLAALSDGFGEEYRSFDRQPVDDPRQFTLANGGYGAGDAEVYYAMLRRLKPRRIVEIGCGFSTLVAQKAFTQNQAENPDYECAYICIEPFLPDYLDPLPGHVSKLVEKGVQDVPLDVFEDLEAGDILFIDSTHVTARGSDVVYEYLEILPRLKPGVIIHIHDIFLPRDYPAEWMKQGRFFWNEQYLLQAFLLHNDDYEVILPSHALYTFHYDAFERAVPSLPMSEVGPAGFWIRKREVSESEQFFQ